MNSILTGGTPNPFLNKAYRQQESSKLTRRSEPASV